MRHTLVLVLFALAMCTHGDSRFRLKLAGDISRLPAQDVNLQVSSDAMNFDHVGDFRYIYERKFSNWRIEFHTIAQWTGGDSIRLVQSTEGRGSQSNEVRFWDLSNEFSSGNAHRVAIDVDRFNLTFRNDRWSVKFGRLPLSWGNGLVYQPMDVFNAYAPTTIDREFKPGNDSLLVERLFDNGIEVQVIGILRNPSGTNESDSSTMAIKSYFPVGEYEFELILGQHYDDAITGISFSLPVKDLLVRTDIVRTCTSDDNCATSAIANVDYSFSLGGGIIYAFAEYFRNGFGVKSLNDGLVHLPESLTKRIGRSEVFAYGNDLVAFGASVAWHPLWSQTISALFNAQDGSALLQSYVNYTPTDYIAAVFGFRKPIAGLNEEFGEISLNDEQTTGGRTSIFLELTYYR